MQLADLGILPDRAPQLHHRFIVATLVDVQGAQSRQGIDEIGVQPEGFQKIVLGLGVILSIRSSSRSWMERERERNF